MNKDIFSSIAQAQLAPPAAQRITYLARLINILTKNQNGLGQESHEAPPGAGTAVGKPALKVKAGNSKLSASAAAAFEKPRAAQLTR